MSKIKSFFLYSAAVLMSLTACTDDSDGDNGGNGGNNNPSVITKSGNITADETWTADNVYRLEGRVTVTGGATLTIQPGTIIKGAPGTGAFASALLISRDGMIDAEGTATEPIIFTSVADDIQPGETTSPNMNPNNNGLWGGVIILGSAPISASAAEVQIEGIPSSDQNGLYGGSDPADNSGTFSYVSIRHGGSNIGQGNEINGLTMGGVGSGTTISNIEIVANQDDGVEWFGGNVDASNVLVWNCGDDGLDTDQDWIGECSNFLIVTPRGGSAFELDGPEGTLNRGCHTFSNGIVYAGADIDHLIDWDGNTNAGLNNVYFYGIADGYGYIAADPANDVDEFIPFESWGGDGNCTTSGIEVTFGNNTIANMFAPSTTVPSSISVVANGGASTDVSVFGWTWASQSGALTQIGL